MHSSSNESSLGRGPTSEHRMVSWRFALIGDVVDLHGGGPKPDLIEAILT